MINDRRHIARYDVLDFYRFAGAVIVAIVHYTNFYLPISIAHTQYVGYQFQPLMGFFFTLSGFVIMHVYAGRVATISEYGDYLKKRLARMYPLHVATFLIAPFFVRLYFPDCILPNLLLIHAWDVTKHLSFNYPSWSVSAEFFVYLLFPIFYTLMIALGRFAILFPLIFALILTIAFQALGLPDWNGVNYNFGCLRAVPSFVAGMLVYQLTTQRFNKLKVPVWIAHGSTIATIPLMLSGVPDQIMLVAMASVVFLLAKSEPAVPGILSKPFPRALANSSYGFYLLHASVGAFIFGRAVKTFHLANGEMYAVVPVAIAATAALAVLSFRYFENPARRFLSEVRFMKRNSSSSVRSRPTKRCSDAHQLRLRPADTQKPRLPATHPKFD
jgi:peptidoglycan/LPS O-acetylase OafA/YrhL